MIENEIEEGKRKIYLISGIAVTLLIVLGVWWYYTRPGDVKEEKSPQAEIRSNTSKALSKEFKASPPMSTSKDKEKAQEPSFSSATEWTQENPLWVVGGVLVIGGGLYYYFVQRLKVSDKELEDAKKKLEDKFNSFTNIIFSDLQSSLGNFIQRKLVDGDDNNIIDGDYNVKVTKEHVLNALADDLDKFKADMEALAGKELEDSVEALRDALISDKRNNSGDFHLKQTLNYARSKFAIKLTSKKEEKLEELKQKARTAFNSALENAVDPD